MGKYHYDDFSLESRERDFLEELTKISKKHGIFITGCGCCGSPCLIAKDEDEWESEDIDNGDLKWNSMLEKYEHDGIL